jgi:hypothetical protein
MSLGFTQALTNEYKEFPCWSKALPATNLTGICEPIVETRVGPPEGQKEFIEHHQGPDTVFLSEKCPISISKT